MVIQAPTRITIEVHGASEGSGADGAHVVRVIPEGSATQHVAASEPREAVTGPSAFDPGPCRCLDDDDCNADHAND